MLLDLLSRYFFNKLAACFLSGSQPVTGASQNDIFGQMKRCILICLALLTAACSSRPADRLFIGTYTGTGSDGIYTCTFSAERGELGALTLAAKTANPSFLTFAQSGKFLYAVNELGEFNGESSGAVNAFEVDRTNGALTLLNQVPSHGGAPCHVSLDRSEKFLFVANYSGGSIAVLPVNTDGQLGHATSIIQFQGSGKDSVRQQSPHAHFVQSTPDNRFVLVVDLGTDRIMIFRFDASTGELTRNSPPHADLEPGAGPRHLVMTPSGTTIFVLNELNSTITRFDWDAPSGAMTKGETVSTLPPDFTGPNTAAEILIDSQGKFIYASNRGHDSIVRAAIDTDGKLSVKDWTPSGGQAPRHIGIDPSGRWLFASNQRSDVIALFKIDATSGALTQSPASVKVASPVCVRFKP